MDWNNRAYGIAPFKECLERTRRLAGLSRAAKRPARIHGGHASNAKSPFVRDHRAGAHCRP